MSDARHTGVAGVVLAAGASRRLGQAKQLLTDEDGRAMVVRVAGQLREAGCEPVIVITGAAHDGVKEAVSRALESPDATVVFNAAWPEGMASSIRCAVDWLNRHTDAADTDAVLIAACDMPGVTSEHVTLMLSAFRKDGVRIASTYDTQSGERVRGIPALFPRADWGALLALSGDRGARDLLAEPDTSVVVLPTGGFDLDTPDDVARWRARTL